MSYVTGWKMNASNVNVVGLTGQVMFCALTDVLSDCFLIKQLAIIVVVDLMLGYDFPWN